MKVLIIPEDQALDQYIVKPVVEAMLNDAEIPSRVDVIAEPRLRGASEALDAKVIDTIIKNNPMVDLFLLIVDRDCNRERNEERAEARQREHEGKLLACVAHQEVEVWMLALYADRLDVTGFAEVRQECDPKERWAEPLLRGFGGSGPGKGRKRAMSALKGSWRSLAGRCPELLALQMSVRARRNAG